MRWGSLIAMALPAVVLLTAFSQRDLIAQARDAGVMAYVVKPFSAQDLVPAIEGMLLATEDEAPTR